MPPYFSWSSNKPRPGDEESQQIQGNAIIIHDESRVESTRKQMSQQSLADDAKDKAVLDAPIPKLPPDPGPLTSPPVGNKRPHPSESMPQSHSVDSMDRATKRRTSSEHSSKGRGQDAPSISKPDDLDEYEEGVTFGDSSHPSIELLRSLQTRAITINQLIQEVKGIYGGLVMVEKKCIEIVTQQATNPTQLTKEQWQALIALHRTLLNEHHDFFSASHHPVTKGHELRELAAKYAMPARMWRHGIHAFLELLRHRLPDSLEHMLSFVYLAYSMMALLMETVPDFLETWIECLGDLARYRMAIEESDLRDREVWAVGARTWYNKAADLSPNTGRIHHHNAVLARPDIVKQLFLYSKALVATVPFKNAGESILLLFNPLVERTQPAVSRYSTAELNLVTAAAVLFKSREEKKRDVAEFTKYQMLFKDNFEPHMQRLGPRFKAQGVEIAASLFAMVFDFGKNDNPVWKPAEEQQITLKKAWAKKQGKPVEKLPKDFAVQDFSLINPIRDTFWSQGFMDPDDTVVLPPKDQFIWTSRDVTSLAGPMLRDAISSVAGSIGNKNAVPFMHVVFAYLYAMTFVPRVSIMIEKFVPWARLVEFLNTVSTSGVVYRNIESETFPISFGGSKRQLVEDFALRGLNFMGYYYPVGFFDKDNLLDEDERLLELPSHQTPRVERCLWCAHKLTLLNRWITYDTTTNKFDTTDFARGLATA